MMESAHSRLRINPAHCGWTVFNGSMGRSRLRESEVRSVLLIISQILTPKPSEMAFVERDDVVKHLAASTADPSFGDSVLPGAPHTRSHRFHAARLQKPNDLIAELSIPIEQRHNDMGRAAAEPRAVAARSTRWSDVPCS